MKDKKLEQLINEISEQGIIEAFGDAVSIHDTNFKILYQNDIAKRIIGDHVGNYCYKAYENRDNICKGCPLAETFNDGKVRTTERHNPVRPQLIVEITTSAIKDSKGKIIAGIEVVRDVTELKQIEENLKEYKLLISKIKDLAAVCDNKGNVLFLNDVFEKMTNHKPEEFIGKSFAPLLDDENLKIAIDGYTKALKGESPQFEVRFKDTGILCEFKNMALRNEKGDIIRVIGIGRDITERKKAEEELQKAKVELEFRVEERTAELKSTVKLLEDEVTGHRKTLEILENSEKNLRVVFDNTKDGILIADPETGKFYDSNKMMVQMMGYSFEEINEMGVMDLHRKEDLPHIIEQFKQMARGKITHAETIPFKRKDGSVFYADINSSHIMLDGRKYVLGIFKDITERKKAEEIFQRTFEELKDLESIINRSPAMAFIWPMKEGWPVEFVTNNVKEVLGYTADDFMSGKVSWPAITHHKDVPRLEEEIAKYLEEGITEFSQEYRLITKSGDVRWMTDRNKVVYDSNNTPTHIQSIVLDITERKKAEIALKKAHEEIEAWNRELESRVWEKTEELVKSQAQLVQSEKLSSIGQLAAGLAHELNSPLTGLISMTRQYRKGTERDSKEHGELSLMLSACEYMAKIVKDFNAFSGKSRGEITECNLFELIESSLNLITSELKLKNIQITKDHAAENPIVKGDKTELQQVVLNIIRNAVDAMDDGGRLVIKTVLSEDKSNVMMKFIDNGCGIKKEDINNIFEPFFTTRPQGMGTGLGLSVSYAIVKNHGGEITVESEAGKGTEFEVLLPAVT